VSENAARQPFTLLNRIAVVTSVCVFALAPRCGANGGYTRMSIPTMAGGSDD